MGLRKKNQEIENASLLSSQHGSFSLGYGFLDHDSEDVELDIIERLKSNVFKLGDLQSRLGFMNNELEKVIGSHRKSGR